jgi:hypothetical protein
VAVEEEAFIEDDWLIKRGTGDRKGAMFESPKRAPDFNGSIFFSPFLFR